MTTSNYDYLISVYNDIKQTFILDALNEDFYNKVIFIYLSHSSGLGGPGCLIMITSDNKEYFIGFDAGTIVSYLQDDRRFVHGHPLPFFLEEYEPKESDDDYELLNCASHLLKQECSLDFFTSVYEEYRNKRLK